MRVRALQTGFYGCLHIPGTDSEEFDVQDGEKASWFAPVDPPGNAPATASKGGKKTAPATDQPGNDLV